MGTWKLLTHLLFKKAVQNFPIPLPVLWPDLKWCAVRMMQVAVRHISDKISSVLLSFPSNNSWIWLYNCNLIGWRLKITDGVTAFRESYCGLGNDGQVPWAKAVFYSHLDSYTDNMLLHRLLWAAHLEIRWTHTESAPWWLMLLTISARYDNNQWLKPASLSLNSLTIRLTIRL